MLASYPYLCVEKLGYKANNSMFTKCVKSLVLAVSQYLEVNITIILRENQYCANINTENIAESINNKK